MEGHITKLQRHGLTHFALTGSVALAVHLNALGHTARVRPPNDLDIVVDSFNSIPVALADGFLFRHIHPNASQGKLLVQLVDAGAALRIDVFSAYGDTMARTRVMNITTISIRVVSLEDLAARAASLVMDLDRGKNVQAKHARDFLLMAGLVHWHEIEAVWEDHRKPSDPETFREAFERIADLVHTHSHMLIVPEYSHDFDAVCPKCYETGPFRLASSKTIHSILGYC